MDGAVGGVAGSGPEAEVPPTGSWPAGRTARSRPGSRRRRRARCQVRPSSTENQRAAAATTGRGSAPGWRAGRGAGGCGRPARQGVVQVQQGQRAEFLGRDRRPEPVGAENLFTSRDPGILVDHSPPRRSSRTPVRWPLEQAQGRLPAVAPGRGAVRPVFVGVHDGVCQHRLEMSPTQDQHPVQQLSAEHRDLVPPHQELGVLVADRHASCTSHPAAGSSPSAIHQSSAPAPPTAKSQLGGYDRLTGTHRSDDAGDPDWLDQPISPEADGTGWAGSGGTELKMESWSCGQSAVMSTRIAWIV